MFKKGILGTPSSINTSRVRNRTPFVIGNGLALMAFGLFAAAAALAVVKPHLEQEPPLVYQTRQALALPSPFPDPLDNYRAPFVQETQIRRGDTLAALLARLHVDDPGLRHFLVQDKSARSIYKLYPGRSIQAALDKDGKLVWLRYNHTPGINEKNNYVSKWLEVTPDQNGGFTASERSQAAETHVRMAEGQIDNSLFGATDAANIPDAVTLQMTDILGSKIDFIKDLREGDRFRVVYESYSHDGNAVGTGRVLALEFVNNKKIYEAAWFAPDQNNTSGSYYDFGGHSLKGAFLRTALQFTRISSTFGMRKHPLHGSWRSHNGVDYAAQANTPIRATGHGKVKFIGWQNGYGNVVVLQHDGKYSTLYAHQRSFAKGLKKGDTVEQGQVIGYVGATGWATGPHLHYEFRIGDKPVDPLSVDLPVTRTLDKSQRKLFESVVAGYKTHIDMLASMQVASR